MNILHVIASLAPRYGGPSKACLEMAQATAKLGHTVSIVTTNIDGAGVQDVPLDRPVNINGVEVRYCRAHWPHILRVSLPLAAELGRRVPSADIVHVHSLYLFHGIAAGHLCRRMDVPYIIRPHGTLDPFITRRRRLRKWLINRLYENRNLRGCAALHFTAQEEWSLALPHTYGRPGFVVPNAIHVGEYERLPPSGTFRAMHPELGEDPFLLFLSRISYKKGLDILAPAFARLVRRHQRLRLVIAGPDDEGLAASIKKQLFELGCLEKVHFVGQVQGEEKLAALRDAAIFVLPSYSENFGIAVVEAMACGLPVVISDKVNIWNEVAGAEAGKVTPCEPEAVAAGIESILNAPDKAEAMGKKGKQLAYDSFEWQSVAKLLVTRYNDILQGNALPVNPIIDGTS